MIARFVDAPESMNCVLDNQDAIFDHKRNMRLRESTDPGFVYPLPLCDEGALFGARAMSSAHTASALACWLALRMIRFMNRMFSDRPFKPPCDAQHRCNREDNPLIFICLERAMREREPDSVRAFFAADGSG